MSLRTQRAMILAAAPLESAELKTIFSDQPESIRRRLEDPADLRVHGWGLATLDRARFVGGQFIRVGEVRKVIDLYRDGYLVLGGEVTSEFLAWSNKDGLKIHPLALIELVANFTRFYSFVLADFRSRPKSIEVRIELTGMHLDGRKTRLPAGAVGTTVWEFGGHMLEAPSNDWGASLTVLSDSYNPDAVAFSLIRELYVWFGHSEDNIPYTRLNGDVRVIDTDTIASIR
jgi:hypothetical protein